MAILRRGTRLAVAAIAGTIVVLLATATPASAAWTTIERQGFAYSRVCKTAIDSIYGPLWRITVQAYAPVNWRTHVYYGVYRNGYPVEGNIISIDTSYHQPGTLISRTVHASRLLGDTYMVSGVINSYETPGNVEAWHVFWSGSPANHATC